MTIKVMFRDVLDLVPQSTVRVNDVTVGKVTEGRPQGLRRRGHPRDPRGRQAAGQRPRGDPADQPPRREVRPAQRAARPRHRQAGEQRRDRPGPHRSQPRGRRGPRRALAAAQRRRRRPAQDDLLRAEQRLGGPRAPGALGADPDPHLHGAAGRRTRRPSSPRSRTPTAWPWRSAATTARSRPRSTTSRTRCDRWTASAPTWSSCSEALTRLSGVGVRVIRASKESTINSLRHLGPVLEGFAKAGDNFAKSFQVFLTYPFIDEAVGRNPQVARNLHMGDYTNLSVNLDINVPTCSRPAGPRCRVRRGADRRQRERRPPTGVDDSGHARRRRRARSEDAARTTRDDRSSKARRRGRPSSARPPTSTPAATCVAEDSPDAQILHSARLRSCSTASGRARRSRRRRSPAAAGGASGGGGGRPARACRAPSSAARYQEPQPIDPFGLAAHGLDAGPRHDAPAGGG